MKMPDLSELKKKVNLQSMVDNVKSAIDTVSSPKAIPTSDALSNKFSELTNLLTHLSDINAQQANAITDIKSKLSALDRDIQTVKTMAHDVAQDIETKSSANVEKSASEESSIEDTLTAQKTPTEPHHPDGESYVNKEQQDDTNKTS